jgi:flavin reductase (DIM6/NTAB) family NADH-FMN oxidoreductase RutF/DNA-binding IclR family transcriptional regulator
MAQPIDPQWYRQVLGQYPTGVCVVTARDAKAEPVAMVVGSFTSVSLDPPLVAFFPDRGSSSWAKLRDCAHFCVNILGADQEPICRKLASKNPDKFAGIAHRMSDRGNPVVDGVVAWIECERHSVTDAGDHEMVMGRVLELDIAAAGLPLLFFQGGYGRFAPASIGVEQGGGLTASRLRDVDRARSEMEPLAESLKARCIATVRVADELIVAASAGQARRGGTATLVGQRLPFAPPTGSVFAAWLSAGDSDRWLQSRSVVDRNGAAAALQAVRRRGFSVGLLNEAQRAFSERLSALAEGSAHHADLEDLLDALAYDPLELTPENYQAVRVISAPVFDSDGQVALALTLHDFPKPEGTGGVTAYIEQVVGAAERVTKRLGGRIPDNA